MVRSKKSWWRLIFEVKLSNFVFWGQVGFRPPSGSKMPKTEPIIRSEKSWRRLISKVKPSNFVFWGQVRFRPLNGSKIPKTCSPIMFQMVRGNFLGVRPLRGRRAERPQMKIFFLSHYYTEFSN